jgi:molybdopterin-guanine dinucleotide biosynthesis protein A
VRCSCNSSTRAVCPSVAESAPAARFAGAVLAGGASSRLGRDKALVELAGLTLVERAANALRRSGAGPLAVIGGDEQRLASLGLSVIRDGWPGRGPLGGILTAFAWSPLPVIAVLACDLPFVGPSVVEALAEALDRTGADAAVAHTTGREPLCALWRIERCEAAMLAAFTAGERAVHRAAAQLVLCEVPVDRSLLLNVNTEDELAAAEARLAGPTA